MTMKTISSESIKQLNKFLNSGDPKLFTESLYQELYLIPGFIAHYNREGFLAARFETQFDDYQITKEILYKVVSEDVRESLLAYERRLIHREILRNKKLISKCFEYINFLEEKGQ